MHTSSPVQACDLRAPTEPVSALAAEPRSFPGFPHEPYSIQLDFMRALYDTIDTGGIGLFESPTGEWVCMSCRRLALDAHKVQHSAHRVADSRASEHHLSRKPSAGKFSMLLGLELRVNERNCCSGARPLCGAGTGKTLSLICGSLQWLQDKHARDAAADCRAANDSSAGARLSHRCCSISPSGGRQTVG